MIMHIKEFSKQTSILYKIKQKIKPNASPRYIRYWVAGYYLNKQECIIKITPTHGLIKYRNDEQYENLAIFNIETREKICNIPNLYEVDSFLENIYISDSEEEIIKTYNDLVYKTHIILNKEIENINIELEKTHMVLKEKIQYINVELGKAENDFYKTDIIMEKLTR